VNPQTIEFFEKYINLLEGQCRYRANAVEMDPGSTGQNDELIAQMLCGAAAFIEKQLVRMARNVVGVQSLLEFTG
jgi:hypothetical protein